MGWWHIPAEQYQQGPFRGHSSGESMHGTHTMIVCTGAVWLVEAIYF